MIFRSRASWVEAMPFLWLAIIQMAMNHLRNGNFVSSKMVPTLIENRWRQSPHLWVRRSEKW